MFKREQKLSDKMEKWHLGLPGPKKSRDSQKGSFCNQHVANSPKSHSLTPEDELRRQLPPRVGGAALTKTTPHDVKELAEGGGGVAR